MTKQLLDELDFCSLDYKQQLEFIRKLRQRRERSSQEIATTTGPKRRAQVKKEKKTIATDLLKHFSREEIRKMLEES